MNGGPSGFSELIHSLFQIARSSDLRHRQIHIPFPDFYVNFKILIVFVIIADNAPVTRGIIVASALFTVFFGLQGRSNKLGFSYLVNQAFLVLQFCLNFPFVSPILWCFFLLGIQFWWVFPHSTLKFALLVILSNLYFDATLL